LPAFIVVIVHSRRSRPNLLFKNKAKLKKINVYSTQGAYKPLVQEFPENKTEKLVSTVNRIKTLSLLHLYKNKRYPVYQGDINRIYIKSFLDSLRQPGSLMVKPYIKRGIIISKKVITQSSHD